MGALRLFDWIASALQEHPERMANDSLDRLAEGYEDFAYIGSRRTLRNLVATQAEKMQRSIARLERSHVERLHRTNPKLADDIQALRGRLQQPTAEVDIAGEWYGKQWEKDSGLFPDFVLAWDKEPTFGNGSLVELKDSKGDSVASFNSTIPTRFKSLQDVEHITGSQLITRAAILRDMPESVSEDYRERQRRCLYFVRTRAQDLENVRVSLVEGSFFETLPKERLLEEVWGQILMESGAPEAQRAEMVRWLSRLKQTDIAQSRTVPRASVKPRLRIMAEVHGDANIHRYPEIAPRTVNLVFKREPDFSWTWLQEAFSADGFPRVRMRQRGDEAEITLGTGLSLTGFTILHKRNGEHIVLQMNLPT